MKGKFYGIEVVDKKGHYSI